jgi:glycosyltransferase involved in cell wall biosynthesis
VNSRLHDWTIDNPAWANAAPALSILIPFLSDDPSALIAAIGGSHENVELILLDDGGGDSELTGRVAAVLMDLALPARLVGLAVNEGRARARNRLAGHARAEFLLFLDADMLPDCGDFVQRWLELARASRPDVAFGGFTLRETPARPEHALHRAMALASDCAPVDVRARMPAKHVFTSNLLVRADVFAADRFDETFRGWGWEDVEWATRAARRRSIVHIDNPASHLGLDRAEALAGKYEQSVGNFAKFIAAHPDQARSYPCHRIAGVLRLAPLRTAWRPALKRLALTAAAPLRLRALALRLYRAALYADVV